MSSNYETVHGSAAAHSTTPVGRKNSYSRKRWNAFDTWQEHIRKSAAAVGVAFPERHDRDMRRAIVSG
jgi:hypothetical protein